MHKEFCGGWPWLLQHSSCPVPTLATRCARSRTSVSRPQRSMNRKERWSHRPERRVWNQDRCPRLSPTKREYFSAGLGRSEGARRSLPPKASPSRLDRVVVGKGDSFADRLASRPPALSSSAVPRKARQTPL